jgi:hypothetical protein
MAQPFDRTCQCGSRRTSHFRRPVRVSSLAFRAVRAINISVRKLYGKDVAGRLETVKDININVIKANSHDNRPEASANNRVDPLSRRKHGFESRWARQRFQCFRATPANLSQKRLTVRLRRGAVLAVRSTSEMVADRNSTPGLPPIVRARKGPGALTKISALQKWGCASSGVRRRPHRSSRISWLRRATVIRKSRCVGRSPRLAYFPPRHSVPIRSWLGSQSIGDEAVALRAALACQRGGRLTIGLRPSPSRG